MDSLATNVLIALNMHTDQPRPELIFLPNAHKRRLNRPESSFLRIACAIIKV